MRSKYATSMSCTPDPSPSLTLAGGCGAAGRLVASHTPPEVLGSNSTISFFLISLVKDTKITKKWPFIDITVKIHANDRYNVSFRSIPRGPL